MSAPQRPTAAQLYNATLLLALAEGTPGHRERSAQVMGMFDRASWGSSCVALARFLAWRYSPAGRRMAESRERR